jgi:Gpi18-like mannosyltransferase
VKPGVQGAVTTGASTETDQRSGAQRWRERWALLRDWAQSPAGRVWVDAGQIWLFTRVMFLALTYLVPTLLVRNTRITSVLEPLHSWAAQDGAQYLYIAQNGYDAVWRTNFWPLFPMLGHLLGPVFGGDDVLSLMVVANVAFFGALAALRWLAERELGPDAAFRTSLYLAVFPTAFYFFAPYTESLFLCFAIAAFAAMRERRWWLAGALGLLATLTRSSGALLLAPFAIEYFFAWRGGRARWHQALASLLIPAGVAIYSVYLTFRFNDPLAFDHGDVAYQRHQLTLPWELPGQLLAGMSQVGAKGQIGVTHFVLNLAVTLCFIGMAVVIWRTLPLSYAAYSIAILAYMLIFLASDPTGAVGGNGRYVLMIFPAFMVLGAWGERRWLHTALLVCMLPVLAILCAHFLLGLAGG